MVVDAEKLARRLSENGIEAGVVNARFVKPLDTVLAESAKSTRLIVTMEDHVITGGRQCSDGGAPSRRSA